MDDSPESEEIAMATFTTNSQSERSNSRPAINRQGRSVAERASIKVTQLCLREYEKSDGFWTATGQVLTGNEAYLRIAEYNKANFDRRFDNYRKELRDLSMQSSFEEETRALNGKTVQQRANEYIVGKIMSAFNTAPQSFTVGDMQYRAETISFTRYMDPADAVAVIKGTKSIGNGQSVSLYEEAMSNQVNVIDKESLMKCVELFKEILTPTISGNQLFWGNKLVATFSDTASSLDNIQLGDRTFSVEDIQVL